MQENKIKERLDDIFAAQVNMLVYQLKKDFKGSKSEIAYYNEAIQILTKDRDSILSILQGNP